MNTRILTMDFDYAMPQTLAEAFGILADKKNVKILAGGTDLLVKLKTGAKVPMNTMMDIKRIDELAGIKKLADGSLEIGATTKLAHIEKEKIVAEKYPALFDALKAMAATAVRNMGSIGGNLANASPAADTAGPCLVYEAKFKLVSAQGERFVAVKDFFTGPGKTVMQKGELLAAVILAAPVANSGAAFMKKTRVKPDISKISTTILLGRDGAKITKCNIAMGSVAATPLWLPDIAAQLVGEKASLTVFDAIGQKIGEAIHPIDDNRSTAEYRKKIAKVLVTDVLTIAWQRAGGVL